MADHTHSNNDGFRVTMIGGMNGDSFRLESPTGETMVVDSGHWYDKGDTVLTDLSTHDIDYIDQFVATHDDWDHIGGHSNIIKTLGSDGIGAVHGPKVDEIPDKNTDTSKEYKAAQAETGLIENQLEEGDSVDLGSVGVDVLNPSPDVTTSGGDEKEKRNENSLVLQATYGEQSALLTGDIGPKATQHLINEYKEQLSTVDVLVGPHHGADNPKWAELVETCESDTIFFSYDENNGDDHPKDTTLDQTREAAPDADLYAKPLHGTNIAMLDGHGKTTVASATNRPPTRTDDIKLAKYYDLDIEQFDLEEGIPATDLKKETPTEVFDNPNVVDPEPVQRLHRRLDALDPQTEAVEQRIETLHELIDTADPRTEGYGARLALFAEQVDQLDAEHDRHKQLEEEKEELEAENDDLEEKNTEKDETIETLQTESEQLRTEKQALIEQLESSPALRTRLRTRLPIFGNGSAKSPADSIPRGERTTTTAEGEYSVTDQDTDEGQVIDKGRKITGLSEDTDAEIDLGDITGVDYAAERAGTDEEHDDHNSRTDDDTPGGGKR